LQAAARPSLKELLLAPEPRTERTLEERQIEQSLQEADDQLEAVRAECAAAIEHHMSLLLAQVAQDREASDTLMRQLERERIIGLISCRLESIPGHCSKTKSLESLREFVSGGAL
jgi:hypothetical protein